MEVARHHSHSLEARMDSVRRKHANRWQPLHPMVDVVDVRCAAAVLPKQRVESAGLVVVPLHRSSVGASTSAVCGPWQEQGDEGFRNVRAFTANKLQYVPVRVENTRCRSVQLHDVVCPDVEYQRAGCAGNEVQEGRNVTDGCIKLANKRRCSVPEGVKICKKMLDLRVADDDRLGGCFRVSPGQVLHRGAGSSRELYSR